MDKDFIVPEPRRLYLNMRFLPNKTDFIKKTYVFNFFLTYRRSRSEFQKELPSKMRSQCSTRLRAPDEFHFVHQSLVDCRSRFLQIEQSSKTAVFAVKTKQQN